MARSQAIELIKWLSPAVQHLMLIDLQACEVLPYYNMATSSSLQRDVGYISWQSEIASILSTQREAAQVAGILLKEMIERMRLNPVARGLIFKYIEWVLPWINTLNSVSSGVLEVQVHVSISPGFRLIRGSN